MSDTRIDVRGAWPVYIKGMHAVRLVGVKRDITVQEAEKLVREKDASERSDTPVRKDSW